MNPSGSPTTLWNRGSDTHKLTAGMKIMVCLQQGRNKSEFRLEGLQTRSLFLRSLEASRHVSVLHGPQALRKHTTSLIHSLRHSLDKHWPRISCILGPEMGEIQALPQAAPSLIRTWQSSPFFLGTRMRRPGSVKPGGLLSLLSPCFGLPLTSGLFFPIWQLHFRVSKNFLVLFKFSSCSFTRTSREISGC